VADLIDIFGEDFTSVLASLDELPPQVEQMLLGVMDKMVYDVKTFSNALEKSVFSMTQAGASQDIIKQTLANDMGTGGRIFGQLRNDTKASIVDGINQSAKMGQYANYDLDKGEFAWVAVGGHRVCLDCDGRAGQKMTFEEWEGEGLPGSGWSVCQGYCYCVLDPTGKASKKIKVQRPGDTKIEKQYYNNYGLTKQQIAKYEKVMQLTSKSAKEMMARKGITSAQVYADFETVRNKLTTLGRTKDKYYNKRTGKYVKSRAKLHEKLARDIVNKGKIADGQADFLMSGGYPGSGKSTMLDQAFPGWKEKFVHIDSDAIKTLLAKADNIEKLGWRAYAYHDEADAVIDLAFKIAREENRHILFDATMKNGKKVAKILEEYLEYGYKTQTAFADLPIEKSIERAIARYYGESGRFVDPIYIVTHGNQNINSFNSVKDLVGSWAHYSTDVPIKTPALLINNFP
tara:strand:+ start:200 stop:1576 length:1377 start_codon:yes stop_codon:yes gene_type:complete